MAYRLRWYRQLMKLPWLFTISFLFSSTSLNGVQQPKKVYRRGIYRCSTPVLSPPLPEAIRLALRVLGYK